MAQAEPERRDEARDASVLVFGKFVSVAAEGLMPFLIVRILGKADVGAFAGLMLVYTTLATVFTAGFPAAVLYYMAGRSAPQRAAIVRRLYGTVMVLGLIIGALLLLVGLYGDQALAAFGRWISGDEGEPAELHALRYMCLFPVVDVVARVFPNTMIAIGRARGSAVFGVLRGIGMSAGTLIPAALGFGVPGIVVGLTTYSLLQFVGVARVIRREHRGVERIESEIGVADMLRFAFPLSLTDIVNNLNRAVDRYAILLLFSAEAMAEYDKGAWQIPVIFVAYNVGHVYMPRFVELLEQGKGEEVMELWRESIHKVALIVVPVCTVFAVGAEEFVTVGFTTDYIDAAPVFRAYTFLAMGRVASFGALILAAGRSELMLRAAAFTLVANVAITVPLTLTVGFVGPAIGTTVAFIPAVAVYCVYIARALEVDVRRTFPVMRFLAIVALAGLASLPALALKLWVPMHPALALLAYALTVTPCFILFARISGVMTAEDLGFALRWLRLDFLFERRSREAEPGERRSP